MKLLKYITPLFAFVLLACGGAEETEDNQNETVDVDTIQVDTSEVLDQMTFEKFCGSTAELEVDKRSLDSIFTWFENNNEGYSEVEKDSACMIYVDMMYKISGNVEEEDKGTKYIDMQQEYQPYGFHVGAGEGYLWLLVDTDEARKKWKPYISEELNDYLMLGEITGAQYAADAGMLISYVEWADIVLDLEERLIANKDSKYYNEFLSTYQGFLINFMWGMDNTPIGNWEGPGLNEDTEAAYNKVIGDKSHNTGKIIQKHWDKLIETDFDSNWNNRWTPTKDEISEYLGLI